MYAARRDCIRSPETRSRLLLFPRQFCSLKSSSASSCPVRADPRKSRSTRAPPIRGKGWVEALSSPAPDTIKGKTVHARSLRLIGMLLMGACGGGAGGDAVANSAAAVTARTWGLAYLQQSQLPQAEAEFRK